MAALLRARDAKLRREALEAQVAQGAQVARQQSAGATSPQISPKGGEIMAR